MLPESLSLSPLGGGLLSPGLYDSSRLLLDPSSFFNFSRQFKHINMTFMLESHCTSYLLTHNDLTQNVA